MTEVSLKGKRRIILKKTIEPSFEEIIIEFLCELNLDSDILNHLIQKCVGFFIPF